MASSHPPPSAQPLTAAITGFVILRIRSHWPMRFVSSMSIGRGVRHLADVGAGGEGTLVSGDHDGADRVVAVELLQGGAQGIHDLAVQRVELLRPVEANQRRALLQPGARR